MAKATTDLDSKYKIQRPQTSEELIAELSVLVEEALLNNPQWKKEWVTHAVLKRFLEANVTVEASFDVLQMYCKWRVEYDVDNISENDVDIQEEMAKNRQFYVEGLTDVEGRPVVYCFAKNHSKYHNNYKSLYRFMVCLLERVCHMCDESERGDGKFCLVFNLEGFSMDNMDYKCVKKIVWFLKNCYPERVGEILVVNYPWIFYGCWAIIKQFLNDVTRSKVIFCGETEYKQFIESELSPTCFI